MTAPVLSLTALTLVLTTGCTSDDDRKANAPADSATPIPHDSGDPPPPDTGPADSGATDSDPQDTGPDDSGTADTGRTDTGGTDSGHTDTATPAPVYGDAASADFFQGSWGTSILSSNPDRANLFSCAADTGWKSVDAVATADALETTHQNLFLSVVSDPAYSAENCRWQNTERLATELAGRDSDIRMMTSFRDDLSYEGYQQAIRGSRTLQASTGNLLGVNIDDAHEAFSAPWRDLNVSRVTPTEAAALQALAHSTTEPGAPVAFMPYFPAEAFPYVLADDGFVLGARACNSDACPLTDGTEVGGAHFYIFRDDTLEVNATFNPGDVSPDTPHTISLLVTDTIRADDRPYTMDMVFEINGVEVGRYSATDPGHTTRYFDIVELPVDSLLPDADNTLRAWLDSGEDNITQYGRRIIYAWDGRLHHPDGTETRLGLSDITGHIERAPHPSGTEHSLEPLLAGPNTPWNIREYVDGTAFKFASRSDYYDPVLHARVAESICRSFKARDQPCLEVFWANDQWTGDVMGTPGNPSLLEYLHTAQDHTDGIIAWSLQNNMADRSKGSWAARSPWDETYQVAAGLAGETPSVPGWHHGWTVAAAETGIFTAHWDVDRSVGAGIFQITVEVDGEPVVTRDATAESPFSFDFWAMEGSDIAVRLTQVAGYGFAWMDAQFRLDDPSGTLIDLSDATHTSGVSDATEGMYGCFTTYFTRHDHDEACDPGPAR